MREILERLQRGDLNIDQALTELGGAGFETIPDATVDHDRARRCGFAEVVYGAGKTPEQAERIVETILTRSPYALVTRASEYMIESLRARWPEAQINVLARTVLVGTPPLPREDLAPVLIVAAGTSDLPVAEEARVTVQAMGVPVETLVDVGVAGIHRLLGQRHRLAEASVIVVVAGMEGALPSVVGGLVAVPVIAVPTSVGYGASFGGIAALLGMLNSCAAGVGVVNIDNGFGGGTLAARIALAGKRSDPCPESTPDTPIA